MHLNKYTNLLSNPQLFFIRNIFTCRVLENSKNLYDVLEITPSTNMSGIKAAYYKLSKMYHPDLNKDEEAARKFRAITEAYEVLGNARLKKLYDKGVIQGGRTIDPQNPPEDETAEMKFHRKRQNRSQVPTEGHNKDYNYNEWIKAHYGASYKRDQKIRQMKNEDQRRANFHSQQQNTGNAILGSFFAVITFMYINFMIFGPPRPDYDKVVIKNDNDKHK